MNYRLLSKSFTRFFAFCLLLFSGCLAYAAPIIMPAPIPALAEQKDNEIAILEGMGKRGWFIEKEDNNRILAAVNVRTHTAKVWISFDSDKISFAYGGSDNLKCKPQGDSCSSIHKSYNSWVDNLAKDIGNSVSIKRVENKYSQ